MRKMKKVLSVAIVIAMLAGVMTSLAGCGKSAGKTVTLKWSTSWSGQEDEALVLQEVNKRLEKLLPGVQLEFVDNDPQTFGKQLAAGESFDIAWTGYSYNMLSEIKNGAYLPLDEYINEEDTPNIYREMQQYQAEYESAMYEEKLYALPNQQSIINETTAIEIPVDLYEYFDVDAFIEACYASPTTTREVYDILDAYLQKIYSADLVDTDMITGDIDVKHLYEKVVMRGYSTSNSLAYKLFDNPDNEIVPVVETDEYKLWLEYAAKWYEAGYISKDILTEAAGSGSRNYPLAAQTGNWFGMTDEYKGVKENKDTDGYVVSYYINMSPKDMSHTARAFANLGSENTYLTIPYTAEHPEEAIKLLDLLRSEKGTEGNDLFNLLVYGFEANSEEAKEYGVSHYTLDGDLAIGNNYTIQPALTEVYGKPHWVMGNAILAYRTTNIAEGQDEYAIEYKTKRYPESTATDIAGFRFNTDGLDIEISSIKTVNNTYANVLNYGTKGTKYQATYDEYVNKLKTSGLTKIQESMEQQIADYISDK